MTEQIFANNFWGLKDDGFHVLTAKMASTKKTFDEVKSFYNVRASLHEEFGRKLMKHAKVGMGREETGTLQALLSSAHKETEWIAQAHLNLAQKLKTRLEVDLDNFILEQKDRRKLIHTNVEKAHRYKQSNEAYLAKVKEKYESDCAKLITLQTQVTSASGREVERIKQRIDRTQHEIKIQEQEYQNACIKVADATNAWNKTWKLTCDTYQGMEKKRLEFLRHSFSMYINVLSSATSQDQESYERFWKSLDQYDPMNDIQVFINEKGTGSNIPEPEIFVDYMDDPTKTLQKHTVANFPCPTELLTSISSPSESHYHKPELTVRNPTTVAPTATHLEDSLLIKRVRSMTTAPVPLAESTTPSKSTTEKKKSSVRIATKPLPSISSPTVPHQTRHQRKSSIHESYSSKSQQPIPPPPIIFVPEISSSSTTSASEEEERHIRTNRTIKKKEEEEDITIDPRAKVVFAIGNNMFDLGHLGQDEKKSENAKSITTSRRLTTTRRRQPSADLEVACNFSYQSLLEELGIFDKGSSSGSSQANENVEAPENKILVKRLSQREKRPVQQQQQQRQQYQPPDMYQPPQAVHTVKPAVTSTISQQQEMYSAIINNPDPYHKQQHQQHQQQIHQQQYYNQYSNQHNVVPVVGQAVNLSNHPYQNTGTGIYGPPSTVAQSGHQPTLFWAMAIGDWFSGKPDELQYSRGTWLAVTEIRPDGWYYATKFDTRLNALTNEMGYVAQNYVQAHT